MLRKSGLGYEFTFFNITIGYATAMPKLKYGFKLEKYSSISGDLGYSINRFIIIVHRKNK